VSKIVVFGAGGKAGRLITDEAARRGHSVTAAVRDRSDVPGFAEGVNSVTGDPTDSRSVRALAKGEDVFIVAIGGADNTVWLRAAQTLLETLEAIPGSIPRILHMSGGSTLLTPQGGHFFDLPDFPEAFRGPALGQAEALGLLSRPRQRACFLDIPFSTAGLFRARSAHRQVSLRARPSR